MYNKGFDNNRQVKNLKETTIQWGAGMVEALASYQCGHHVARVRFRASVICGLSLLLVLAMLGAFFPGSPILLPPQN